MIQVKQPDDVLRRALTAFDAGSFVRRHNGYKESVSSHSHEYLLTCPCGSSRLRWNAQKGTWICWGHPSGDPLNKSGDTIKLICLLEGIEEIDAIGAVLAGYIGGDAKLETLTSSLSEASKQKLRLLPPIPWPSGVDRLTAPNAPHKDAWRYLATRGLTQAHVAQYQIGYGRSGKLHGYIVFPVFMDRAFVFYQGRVTWDPPAHLSGIDRRQWIELMGYRKTLNPTSAGMNATGSEVLFNYDQASTAETVIVCEGPVDAIKCGPNAVALLGKVAQPVKVERLKRMRASTFVIYLDRGVEEAACAHKLARELSPYARVFVVQPPDGYDAGALSFEQNATIIAAAVPYKPDDLNSPLL